MASTTSEPRRPQDSASRKPEAREEPGLLESVGSFPYWMLKIIDTVTPESLRTKEPPKKNYRI